MPIEWDFHHLAADVMTGTWKAVVAVALAIASSFACAWSDDYYECTGRDGSVEYSIHKCEAGQEQRHIGGSDAPQTPSPVRKRQRPATPALPRSEARPSLDGKLNPELNLATYKCVGKSGDISTPMPVIILLSKSIAAPRSPSAWHVQKLAPCWPRTLWRWFRTS